MLVHARVLTLGPVWQAVSVDVPAVKTFRTAYRDVIYDMLYGEQYIAGAANRVRD